jgi:hypothetical protein
VYVKPFPSGEGKWQVSTEGGALPRWDSTGGRLFFIQPAPDAKVMAADIVTSPTFNIATPKVLFTVESLGRRLANGWDVFPDGKRFVLLAQVQSAQPRPTPTMTIVQNWFAEFRGRHSAGH